MDSLSKRFCFHVGVLALAACGLIHAATGVAEPIDAHDPIDAPEVLDWSETDLIPIGSMGAWQSVAPGLLDRMRGAYDFAPGLRVSFGIERAVYLNGSLVGAGRLDVADVGRSGAEQARALGDFDRMVLSVGADNAVRLGRIDGAAIVIQNSLNGQDIAVVTTIDAATNGLQMLKSLNLGAVLSDALKLRAP